MSDLFDELGTPVGYTILDELRTSGELNRIVDEAVASTWEMIARKEKNEEIAEFLLEMAKKIREQPKL